MISIPRLAALLLVVVWTLCGTSPAQTSLPGASPAAEPMSSPSAPPSGQASPSPFPSATPLPSAVAVPPQSANAVRKPTYTSCNVTGPFLALTFDDGPHPKHTTRLLDLLKERGVKATFYVIGQNVVQYPEIARRIVDEGHEIGNHSYTHPALTRIGAARVGEEISKSNDAIEQATGVRPATMRPPYGAINAALTQRLNEEFNLTVILWSVDPQDWKIRKASHVSNHILQNARPGSIVLSHDIHPSTIDAMPGVLDGLVAKGFRFVTVSELIAMDLPPGSVVSANSTAPAPSPEPSATPSFPTPAASPSPAAQP